MNPDSIKTYGQELGDFKHSAMVTHAGSVVSFAQHENGQFYYTVLNNNSDSNIRKGGDASPAKVVFPGEISKVGYSASGPYKIPAYDDSGNPLPFLEAERLQEANPYLSSTARFSSVNDFQVISDNKHIYLFRQSVDAGHPNGLNVDPNGLSTTSPGRSSLRFNGTDTYLDLGELNLPVTGGYSFEIWCKFDDMRAHSRIFDFGNGANSDNLWTALRDSGNEIAYNVIAPAGNKDIHHPITRLHWTHVAVTVDTSGLTKMYLNGQEVTRQQHVLPAAINRTTCFIGKSNWPNPLFAGDMRDFRFWDHERSAEEIQANMHDRLTGSEDGLELYLPMDEGKGNETVDLARGTNVAIQGTATWSPNTYNQSGSSTKVVPFAENTILVDRFILSGFELKPVREVRYRRSGNKLRPASSKDSLGSTDMNNDPFYEPTTELAFIGGVHQGAFTVSLLPTEVQDIQRWQFFVRTLTSGKIDSYNIERAKDGLFNAMGTLLYTSPDEKYQSAVLERAPGTCPFTKQALVPLLDERKTGVIAMQLNGGSDGVELPQANTLQLTLSSFTLETWIKLSNGASKQLILGTLSGTAEDNLQLYVENNQLHGQMRGETLIGNRPLLNSTWHHVAISYDHHEKLLTTYVDGLQDQQEEGVEMFLGTGKLYVGKNGRDFEAMHGAVEELRIWDYAIYPEVLEDRRNFRMIGNEPGLTAYYRFDEGTGTTINDHSINSNEALALGTPQWVRSTAPIGDHPGIQHRSFGFAHREAGNGLSSALYYQQENVLTGKSQNLPKPVEQNARLLLVASTEGHDPFELPVSDGLKMELTGETFKADGEWKDYSGNGNNANSTEVGNTPHLQTVFNHNHQNFPAVRIVAGQGLELSETIVLGTGDFEQYTVMIVDRYTSSQKGRSLQSRETNWFLGKWAGYDNFYSKNGHADVRHSSEVNEFALNALVVDDTNESWFYNGKEEESRAKASTNPGKLGIGTAGKESEPSDLDVACILIWDRALSGTERQEVEAWLGAKYGLNIDHDTTLPDSDRKYLASVDFAVDRQGKLVEVQETLGLPLLRTEDFKGLSRQESWDRVNELEKRIPDLEAAVAAALARMEAAGGQRNITGLLQGKKNISDKLEPVITDTLEYTVHSTSTSDSKTFSTNAINSKIQQVVVATTGEPKSRHIEFDADHDYLTVEYKVDNSNYRQAYNLQAIEGNSLWVHVVLKPNWEWQVNEWKRLLASYDQDLAFAEAWEDAKLDYDKAFAALQKVLAEIQALREFLDSDQEEMPAHLMYIDNRGLTCSGALLGFAWTDSSPQVFVSSEGKVSLYFRGTKDQFFAAFFQTLGERNHYQLSGGEVNFHLIARSTEAEFDHSTIKVEDGTDEDYCRLIISNPTLNLLETWEDLPRDFTSAVLILNGEASMSTYNYDSNASTNQQHDLKHGSVLFLAHARERGNLLNGNATNRGTTKNATWTAHAPGRALQSKNGNAIADSSEGFERTDDLTIETWLKLGAEVMNSDLLLNNLGNRSDYRIHVTPRTKPKAVFLPNQNAGFYISGNMPDYSEAMTIEFWIKPADASGTLFSKQYRNLSSLIFHPDGDGRLHYKFGINTYSSALGDEDNSFSSKGKLNIGEWNHVAITRGKKTINKVSKLVHSLFINGKIDSKHIGALAPDTPRTSNLLFANGDSYSIRTGAVEFEEVRVWSIERTSKQINDHHNRRMYESEPYLNYLLRGSSYSMAAIRNTPYCSIQTTGGQISSGSVPVSLMKASFTVQVGDSIETMHEDVYLNQWMHLAAVYNQSYGLAFENEAYVDCGNSEVLNLVDELTIEVFMEVPLAGSAQSIITKGNFAEDASEESLPYALYLSGDGYLHFVHYNDNGHSVRHQTRTNISPGFHRLAVVRRKGTEELNENFSGTVGGVTKTVERIVDVKEFVEIQIFVDGTMDARFQSPSGSMPKGNDSNVIIGASYIGEEEFSLNAKLAEVRLWNKALSSTEIGTLNLTGREAGLVAHWQMEENEGFVVHDHKGGNHGTIHGAQWIKSPDPEASTFELFLNGNKKATHPGSLSNPNGVKRLEIGAFHGELEEVRIWDIARTPEQIKDNLFGRLRGEKKKLIAYYPMDGDFSDGIIQDYGLRGNDLRVSDTDDLYQIPSTAPISRETSQVRSALSGFGTTFNEPIGGSPDAAEYAEVQTATDGTLSGVLKRCYSYIQDGRWILIDDYKVGNLYQEWIGQAQYDPQVIGFVEGAPPVPGENLTEGPVSAASNYKGASSVTITEAEEYSYTVSSTAERGFNTALSLEGSIGVTGDINILKIIAPLGVGFGIKSILKAKTKISGTLKGSLETSNSWTDGESLGNARSTTTKQQVSLSGQWEDKDYSQNDSTDSSLTRRYVPENKGFAFVQSQTADIFALRLVHNNALVMMRMLPNPDIPRDTNIIPFEMNPYYTKQGTLDGRVGFNNDGSVHYDEDYPAEISSDYGEYSYFKPREAYALKKRIKRQEKDLEEFYQNFDTTPDGIKALKGLDNADLALLEGDVKGALESATEGIEGIVDGITGNVDLSSKFAKRNLANTYVWTADGGFFSEETSLSETKQETQAGSFSVKGEISGGVSLEFEISSLTGAVELSAGIGAHLNTTKTKTSTSESSFGFHVNLNLHNDIGLYSYDSAAGKVVRQHKPAPGKVDAYRFMTFYLEPEKRNFEDLFGKVIDPLWLEGNSANALALKQANQVTKKPPCWRVMHRVTFVSRVLPEFQSVTSPPLPQVMKDIDIESNYQLITRLDSLVRGSKTDFGDLSGAIDRALLEYLPELRPFQQEILELMAAYYGLEI